MFLEIWFLQHDIVQCYVVIVILGCKLILCKTLLFLQHFQTYFYDKYNFSQLRSLVCILNCFLCEMLRNKFNMQPDFNVSYMYLYLA